MCLAPIARLHIVNKESPIFNEELGSTWFSRYMLDSLGGNTFFFESCNGSMVQPIDLVYHVTLVHVLKVVMVPRFSRYLFSYLVTLVFVSKQLWFPYKKKQLWFQDLADKVMDPRFIFYLVSIVVDIWKQLWFQDSADTFDSIQYYMFWRIFGVSVFIFESIYCFKIQLMYFACPISLVFGVYTITSTCFKFVMVPTLSGLSTVTCSCLIVVMVL